MTNKDFQAILERYLSGKASEREIQMIEKWYQNMERRTGETGVEDESALEKRYLTKIMNQVGNTRSLPAVRTSNVFSKHRYLLGIAASALLVVASLFLLPDDVAEIKDPEIADESAVLSWEKFTNESTLVQEYLLPDNSRVTLEPNSSLRYSPDFNVTLREVQLEGQGFFEVVPCKTKPFLVYTNGVTTKVLGTSFTIRSFHGDSKVSVAVKTGKVSVYTKPAKSSDKNEEIILTPNQEIVFDKAEKVVAKRIVEKPEPIIPAEEIDRMRFEDAPVSEVFKAIEKIYGVDIQYDENQFAFCTITTSVSGGGLYDRLDIITSTIGVHYELEENKIIVNGTGCH